MPGGAVVVGGGLTNYRPYLRSSLRFVVGRELDKMNLGNFLDL